MNILQIINDSLKSVDFDAITTVQAKVCRSFEELVDIYRRDLTVTPSFVDCLAISCAVHIAVKLDGDPLWMYLVGAPSSGKSTLCELLSSDEHNTRPLSKFTGLVSGSRQGAHLVPMLHNRCVIVKDGTLLLESSPIQLANVYGELRDIFDGSLEAHYRNGVSASYSNISFGMIIGITERIYALNMSALGERFLHCRLETNRDTERLRNENAIDAIFTTTHHTMAEGDDVGDARSFPIQREYTAGFLGHLHSRVRSEEVIRPRYTSFDKKFIQSLADIVACSRASAAKDQKDNILYESGPEASTRVVKQIARLALCLCYVYGVNEITPRIRELLKKVALDTAWGRQYHIIRTVANAPSGLTRASIATKTEVALETCIRSIKDLCSLGILQEDMEASRKGSGGSRNKILTCDDWVRESFLFVENVNASVEDDPYPKKKVSATGTNPARPKRKKKKKSVVKR